MTAALAVLMKVKKESEKAGLKLKIQKTKIMASGPITSWQIDGNTMETVTDFIFLGSKITVKMVTAAMTTPAFLPEESQGQGSLMGCRVWGRTESDTTEAT